MAKRKLKVNDGVIEIDDHEPAAKRTKYATNGEVSKALAFTIEFFGGSDKGKKAHMEDRRISIADLSTKFQHAFTAQNSCRLFSIIDGHGGSAVSSWCQSHLSVIFIENLKKYVLAPAELESALELGMEEDRDEQIMKNVQRALHATFKSSDDSILQWLSPMKSEGACCTLVYFQNDLVFTANVGDCKTVLARVSDTKNDGDDDEEIQPLVITKDHTVLQLSEVKRIESCHGRVVNGRVNGVLEVTRSFGDPEMKKFGVSAAPSVSKFQVCARDKFMIIACDGLWSVFSASDAVDFVYEKFNHTSKPSAVEVTRQLLAEAIINKQAKDNVSAIIIRFNHV